MGFRLLIPRQRVIGSCVTPLVVIQVRPGEPFSVGQLGRFLVKSEPDGYPL